MPAPPDAELERLEAAAARLLGDAQAHAEAGLANLRARAWARGTAHLRVAVAARPGFAEAWSNLAYGHYELGDLAAAEKAASQALVLRPELADAWNLRGLARERRGDLAGARTDYEQALALAPAFAHARVNLANVDQAEGRLDAARTHYEAATRQDPSFAEAHYNLAHLLHKSGREAEATEPYRRAIGARSDHALAHHNLAHVLLMLGRFDEGWRESAWRPPRLAHEAAASRAGIPYTLPAAPGAVTLVSEQGLGDAIFFLRFVPLLRERGWRFTFAGSTRLAGMLSRTGLFDAVQAESAPRDPARPGVLLGDLPLLAGAGAVPPLPLHPEDARLDAMRRRLAAAGPGPYIALAWRAGVPKTGPLETLYKEVPVEALGATLRGTEATFIAVQREPAAGELDRLGAALGRTAHDFCAVNEDLEDALALMALADSSVGVSNTLVHLRAGVSRAAHILVPFPPEWRWMAAGDSPWFPGFRVHRQDPARRWDAALAQLAATFAK